MRSSGWRRKQGMHNCRMGVPTGQQQGSAQEKYIVRSTLPGQPTVQQRKEAKIISTHGEHIEQPMRHQRPKQRQQTCPCQEAKNPPVGPKQTLHTEHNQQKKIKEAKNTRNDRIGGNNAEAFRGSLLVQRYRVRYSSDSQKNQMSCRCKIYLNHQSCLHDIEGCCQSASNGT